MYRRWDVRDIWYGRNRFIVPRSFPAPPLYADSGEGNVQLSTDMRFFDGSGTFSPSIRYISHIMMIYIKLDSVQKQTD